MAAADWIVLYKLGRLALLALVLLGIGLWVFSRRNAERLEAPAHRMLEEDDA